MCVFNPEFSPAIEFTALTSAAQHYGTLKECIHGPSCLQLLLCSCTPVCGWCHQVCLLALGHCSPEHYSMLFEELPALVDEYQRPKQRRGAPARPEEVSCTSKCHGSTPWRTAVLSRSARHPRPIASSWSSPSKIASACISLIQSLFAWLSSF